MSFIENLDGIGYPLLNERGRKGSNNFFAERSGSTDPESGCCSAFIRLWRPRLTPGQATVGVGRVING